MLSPTHATTDDALGLLPSRRNALVVPRRLSRSNAVPFTLKRPPPRELLRCTFPTTRYQSSPVNRTDRRLEPTSNGISLSQLAISDYRPLCFIRELWNEVFSCEPRRCSEHTERPSATRHERSRHSSCLDLGDTYLGITSSSHRLATSGDGSVCGQGRPSHTKRSSRLCDLNSFMGWPTPFASRGPRFSCCARTYPCRRT
jgi:hypothetical protein